MFQSRVMGVGSQRPGDPKSGPYGDIMADLIAKGQRACIGPECQMSPPTFPILRKDIQSPPNVPIPVSSAAPTAFSLPLLLGAAYLLLS
jgi:hypothetical protein